MKNPFLRLSQAWRTTFKKRSSNKSFKTSTFTSNSITYTHTTSTLTCNSAKRVKKGIRSSLANLNRHFTDHFNNALTAAACFLLSLGRYIRNDSPASEVSRHIQSSVPRPPKPLSLRYELVTDTRYLSKREERIARYRADILGGKYVKAYEQRWKREPCIFKPKRIRPENLPPMCNVNLLLEYEKRNRKKFEKRAARKREEKKRRREQTRKQLNAECAERVKQILKPPNSIVGHVVNENEPYNRVIGWKEAERRCNGWLESMPRTADGRLFAYGCGKRRLHGKKNNLLKGNTPTASRKRSLEYCFTSNMEEPKYRKRRLE